MEETRKEHRLRIEGIMVPYADNEKEFMKNAEETARELYAHQRQKKGRPPVYEDILLNLIDDFLSDNPDAKQIEIVRIARERCAERGRSQPHYQTVKRALDQRNFTPPRSRKKENAPEGPNGTGSPVRRRKGRSRRR